MVTYFSDSQNRVAADFSAFVRDWETSQQARNHPSPPEQKWVVFAICMYKCIACHYRFEVSLRKVFITVIAEIALENMNFYYRQAMLVYIQTATVQAMRLYSQTRKTINFLSGRLMVFCLLGRIPNPHRSQIHCEPRPVWC